MSAHGHLRLAGLRISLPATSANLGPGFDAVGLALSLRLRVEAHVANHDSIEATGRDPNRCGSLEDNLILDTYRSVLEAQGCAAPPLKLVADNEIPLGMGCGSSAAARLAGVLLANHFGQLEMSEAAVVAEASGREGHPDNVAACWFGGFTVSVPAEDLVTTASFPGDGIWQLLLALPKTGLTTEEARAMLPEVLSRTDAVFNLQRVALLTAAFAQGRLDLLHEAMEDRLHQPQRRKACALLEHLNHLHRAREFAGVALSGAGPALLGVLAERATLDAAEARMRSAFGDEVELVPVRIGGPTKVEVLPLHR